MSDQQIETLKASERAQMIEETIPAGVVETLKVEEYEVAAAPVTPRTSRRAHRHAWGGTQRGALRGKPAWLWIVVGILALVVLSAAPALNWWGLLLLLPAYSNYQSYRADRAAGLATRHTRSMLRRTIWALVFMGVVLFSAWEMLIPLLLVGWGFSLLAVRAQNVTPTPVY